MVKNYSSRICVSELNKHLINTICKDKLIKSKPDLEGMKISENMIITSMIKNYTGHISLKQFEDDYYNKHK